MSAAIDIQSLRAGDRRVLAKAITLIESTLPAHQVQAEHLIEQVLPYSGNSIRIGISGIPGVGKSTFIEAFGLHLLAQGKKVAVLAVDPSSPLAGGSILGDKTRMEQLSREHNAYIRPSPAAGELGGVAQKTRESLLLCEAAGFDVILIETVGVGQSEYQVAAMVDFFLVLMQPSAGDELQGIKKGIIELADALVINKADGDLSPFAEQARGHYQQALDLLRAKDFWQPKVSTCSALLNQGIDAVWQLVMDYCQEAKGNNRFVGKRAEQNTQWMESLLRQALINQLESREGFASLKQKMFKQVEAGELSPLSAAKNLVQYSSG